jgi:tRNA1Val (adenine37-N6)-methyltransferase
MPNDYFQFKKFLIKQDKCAMKVCTDACLFGAVAANRLPLTVYGVLDIGTGTGLLSLMLAQKLPDAIIDAVEIDEAAAQQATENFKSSLWKKRLNVRNTSIQEFANSLIRKSKYDLVLSNPPFYENDLKSDDEKRNLALHSDELKLDELIKIACELLHEDGNFFVLLPYQRTKYFIELIQSTLFVKEIIFVKQTSKHNYFRTIFWLTKKIQAQHQSEIMIMNDDNTYTNEFTKLLKDYYLNL